MDNLEYDDTSVTTSHYDDEDSPEMEDLNEHFAPFQITGMDCLPRISTGGSDDSWEVESYAADSMNLAKRRLGHLRLDHDDDDNSSLGYGSATPQQRGRSAFVVPDEDDWTVQSDCNDSVGLAENRLGIHAEQYNKVSVQPLARVTRRRASMDNFVQHEQKQVQAAPRSTSRRMSLSTVDTAQDSMCSGSHCSGISEDPSGRRGQLGRHKSMPYVKSSHVSNTVPLWPNGAQTARQKMARRVSNGGTPCAA